MSGHPAGPASLALLPTAADDVVAAARLAMELNLPLLPNGTELTDCAAFHAVLIVHGPALSLQQTRPTEPAAATRRRASPGRRASAALLPGPVSVDFGSDGMRHRRRSGHNELLGRAVGVVGKRALHVLDATAGLGRDGFVLADTGCTVTLCEREPVVAALLSHGLQAARASADAWLMQVARRMSFVAGDARDLAPRHIAAMDVIYLDPMFPRRDKSAAVKKEMALFQLLLDDEAAQQDADALLHWALGRDVARVVVKRPARAPFLAECTPSHSVAGKAVRFDVYVQRALD